MALRDYIEAIEAELARAGVTDHAFEHGGKHPRVRYRYKGRAYMLVFPATPSDGRRGVMNSIADLRRQLGIAAPAQGKSTRPAKRKIPRDTAPMPDSFTVRPDPLEKLKDWKPPPRWIWQRVTGRSWAVWPRVGSDG